MLHMKFYKGVLKSFLSDKFVPGTVCTDIKVAYSWANRLNGNQHNLGNFCSERSRSVIIEIEVNDKNFKMHEDFSKTKTPRHFLQNGWLSKDKAQINTKHMFRVMHDHEINSLMKQV